MKKATARPMTRMAAAITIPAASAGEVLLVFVPGFDVDVEDEDEDDIEVVGSDNSVVTTLSDPPIVVV